MQTSPTRQTSRTLVNVAFAVLQSVALASCTPKEAHNEQTQCAPSLDIKKSALPKTEQLQIVASVDGVPLFADDAATVEPKDSASSDLIDNAIAEHLLAKQAQKEGFAEKPKVQRVFRRALALELIRRRWVHHFGTKDIPLDLVKKSYQINHRRFVHPELIEVSHILAYAPDHEKDKAIHKRAQAAADRVVALLSGKTPVSEEKFARVANEIRTEVAPQRITHEKLTTPRHGVVVEPFAAAAFALKRAGDISPVTQTRFGYHVILLRNRIPGRNSPLEQVETEIRKRIFDEARRVLLANMIDGLRKQTKPTTYPNRLAELAGTSPLK